MSSKRYEHDLNLKQSLDPSKKTAVIIREGNAPEFKQEYNFYNDLYGDDMNLVDIPMYYESKAPALLDYANWDFLNEHRKANADYRDYIEADPTLNYIPRHLKHELSDKNPPPYYNPLESTRDSFLSDYDYYKHRGDPMIEEDLASNALAEFYTDIRQKEEREMFTKFIEDLDSIETTYNPDHVIMMSHQGLGLNRTFGIDLEKIDRSGLSGRENLFNNADVYFGACMQGYCNHPEHQGRKFKDIHHESTASFLSDMLGESVFASPRPWKGFNRVEQDIDSSEGFKESVFFNQVNKGGRIVNSYPETNKDISLFKDGYYIVPK